MQVYIYCLNRDAQVSNVHILKGTQNDASWGERESAILKQQKMHVIEADTS